MATGAYSVLIRTFNCERTLADTLECLRKQTVAPSEYIFVDSGSTDGTLRLLPAGAVLEHYAETEFNYSQALNQGIAHVSHSYVLTISSHTVLMDPTAVEYALRLLENDERLGGAYFSSEDSADREYRLIDKDSFDGFNGLWNTCSIVRVDLLRKRGFRPEVFAAEDQEWASWLFSHEGKAVARILGCGMRVNNPRKDSLQKRLNEYVAIAYYANRKLLGMRNVLRIARKALAGASDPDPLGRRFHLILFLRLANCWVARPRARSRYF